MRLAGCRQTGDTTSPGSSKLPHNSTREEVLVTTKVHGGPISFDDCTREGSIQTMRVHGEKRCLEG